MVTTHFDLAVIGAGPAGAAAALGAAREGLVVGLFEPQALPDKPCGEGILPSGVRALRELGLEHVLANGHALARIRYVLASGRELEIAFPAAGLALERTLLSAALTSALEREARITRLHRRVSIDRGTSGFLVRCAEESWTARTLIAADGLCGGAADWLRGPRHGSRPAVAQRYGVRARAELRAPLEHVEVHLGKTSEVYLTPLGQGRVNVAVLLTGAPDGERSSSAWLAAALQEHPRAARLLGELVTAPEARVLERALPRRVAAGGAFLAGDAAGGVDPVLGCGVAIALVTGLGAASAAQGVLLRGSGAEERAYADLVRQETRFRRALANGLLILARHPRMQAGVARFLRAWPAAGAGLARRVAGSPKGTKLDLRSPEETGKTSAARKEARPGLDTGPGGSPRPGRA
jgi:flavin-dependent dehydrogenase